MAKNKRAPLKIEEIEKALIASRGIMTAASESLGVSRSTVSNRVYKSERLQKVIDEQRKSVGDFAESKLFKHIKEGNLTAIIFYLKTIGRDRGYIERHENELSGNVEAPLVIRRVIVKKEES
jgi:hypothetical protein